MSGDAPVNLKTIMFNDFRQLAKDHSLDKYARIGFRPEQRSGKEAFIFDDIRRKVPALNQTGKVILDIGPGCSDLPAMIIARCEEAGHHLLLSDCEEMLSELPDAPFISKFSGLFPDECPGLLRTYKGRVDGVIAYSILHCATQNYNIFGFLDCALQLLSEGGVLLVGDVPNIAKRRRFFASNNGVRFHQQNMNTTEQPEVSFNTLEPGSIDDGLVLGLALRARSAGFDAYIMPQAPELPMANRREDLLFIRP